MTKERTSESEISGYISSMLREHFGKGPASVYVTLQHPFLIVYFRGFAVPMEKILKKQKETRRILETREMMMADLKTEMKINFWKLAELDVEEIYADWNLDANSGVIIGILKSREEEGGIDWPDYVDKQALMKELEKASEEAQKAPETIEAYWLNDRTIFVRRTGILVRIEKALIENKLDNELKTAKRPLERQILREVELEAALDRKIIDCFVDWDFQLDEGYVVLILEAPSKEKRDLHD